jgi:hypothetical protein
MRMTFVWIAVSAFMCLGVLDLAAGNFRPGLASMMLAGANLLLLQ